MLKCARGRDTAPPSLLLLHLFHDLLPLTATVHCSSSSTPLGLRYLRCVAVTVASTLQGLSEGYHRLRASGNRDADDDVGTAHQSMEKMEVETEMTDGGPQVWPSGSVRVGEILAQAIHCLCGLPTRPFASTSTTTTTTTNTSDPSKASSLVSSSSSLNSLRFKVGCLLLFSLSFHLSTPLS